MRYAYTGLLIVLVLSSIALGIANQVAVSAIRRWDKVRMQWFLDAEEPYEFSRNDLPSTIGVLHYDTYRLAEQKNIILLGSSQVRMGIWPDALVVPDGWHFSNLGMGSDTQSSLRLMVNFLTEAAGHPPNHSDVVVVQIWWLTPKSVQDDGLSRPILKPLIEQFRDYTVDDQLHVHGNPSRLVRELNLIRYRIYVAFAYRMGWPQFEPDFNWPTLVYLMKYISTGQPVFIFRNHHQTLAENQEWIDTMIRKTAQHTTIPGYASDQMLKLITDLSAVTNVVVVNSYEPSYHHQVALEKQYQAWVDSTLKEELARRNIPLIDMRDKMPDNEFLDAGHLTLPGRIRYTKLLMEELTKVLPKTDGPTTQKSP
jgi:hypothetical protein